LRLHPVSKAAAIVVALVAATPMAHADVSHTCVANCGGGSSSSSSGPSGPPPGYDSAELDRIDRENRAREREREAIRAQRAANAKGIRFAKKKAWADAIKWLERANAKYPGDELIVRNLGEARVRQAAEQAQKDAAKAALTAPYQVRPKAIVVPPVELPARPGSQVHDLRDSLETARTSLRERARDAIDFTTSYLKFVALEHMPFANGAVGFYDQLEDAKETRAKYEDAAQSLVDKVIAGQAHEVAAYLGQGRGDPANALDATKRGVEIIGQFVEDRVKATIASRIQGWAVGTTHELGTGP
jgi:hypothetical protein